jgi:hypothetical protein
MVRYGARLDMIRYGNEVQDRRLTRTYANTTPPPVGHRVYRVIVVLLLSQSSRIGFEVPRYNLAVVTIGSPEI